MTQFFIFSALTYNILLTVVRLPGLSMDTARLISQFIFFSSHLTILSIIFFSVVFLKDHKRFYKSSFWLLVVCSLGLMVLSFTGHLEAGVQKVGSQYHSISGEWRPAAQVFYLLFLAYVIYLFIKGYKKAEEDFTRRQIAFVGGAVIISSISSVVFNAIIPTLLKVSTYNFIPQLSFVLLAYVFLFLYLSYQASFVKRSLVDLLKLPYFSSLENIITLRRLLITTDRALSNGSHKMIERFDFVSGQGQTKHSLYLSNEMPAALQERNIGYHFPVRGYMESLIRLEQENLAMGLQIQLAHDLISEYIPAKKLLEYQEARSSIKTTLGLTTKEGQLTPIEQSEKREILKSLARHEYKKLPSAKELGITLNTLKSKIKKYDLMPEKSKKHMHGLLQDKRFV